MIDASPRFPYPYRLMAIAPGTRRAAARVAATLALLLAGCGDTDGGRGDEASGDARADRAVVATLPPIGSIAAYLMGPAGDVVTLLPPGASPDTYEPTPRVAEALAGAAVVFRIGGPVDEWVGTPDRDGRTVLLSDGVPLRDGNPHIWLDPVLVRDNLLPRMADALAAAFPDDADAIRGRAAEYADSLDALHAAIGRALAAAPARRFVSAHAAWLYFADRYGLEQVGVVHRSPGRDVAARELAGIVEAARSSGAAAVIAEPQLGRAGVQALADELRVPVELADPLGGAGVDGRSSYLDLMRFNAAAFARALGAGAPRGAEAGA